MDASSKYEISTDQSRLDIDLIYGYLRSSYWAQNIPRNVVERSIQYSLCFGAFLGGRQVGFARVITDRATFAYLGDVFVVAEHRGRGVAKLLVRAIIEHSDLQGLRRIMLATRDAHSLYAKFGFQPVTHPDHLMTIHRPDAYKKPDGNNEPT